MKRRKKTILGNFILLLTAAAIVLPLLFLVLFAFSQRYAWPDFLPQKFSLTAFHEISRQKGALTQLFFSSILISTVVALLSAVIGLLTARALCLYQFRGKRIVMFLTVLPFMAPATVFAMGIQTTFIRLGLNNTVQGVIAAQLIYSLPYAVRLLTDATAALGTGLEQQARVLGANAWQAFLQISLPLLLPVLLSAAVMSYIVSFSQYFLTLLLGGGQVRTFAIVMVPYLQGGKRNIACMYSLLFLCVTILVFFVFSWIAKRWQKDAGGAFYGSAG